MKCAAASGLLLLANEARGQAPLPSPPTAPAPHAPAPAAPPLPVVVPPRPLSDLTVVYPEGAEGEATVRLILTVDASGAVSAVTVESGEEPFASAASAAAREFRYEPATRGGAPIVARIRIEIAFRPPAIVPAPDDEPGSAAVDPAVAGAGQATADRAGEPRAPPAALEVRVRGERPEPGRTVSLSRSEVRQIPGAFGDPFRAVEIMPGVTPIVSGLPFFFIRGAPPGNVGYFLDGVRVPLLFHVGAGPSVVHPALVDRVDLYPGGYPARFGRYSGGVVAGETAPPTGDLRGEYNVRVFDAGGMVETPFADGRGAALVGGRYSYTGLLLTHLSPDTTLQYWDYQARVGYDLGRRDRVSVFVFGSYDYLGQRTPTQTLTAFEAEFHRIDVRHDHRFGSGSNLRTAMTFGLDRSRVQLDRFVRNRMVGTRTELSHRISERALVRAGTDLSVDTYDVDTGTVPLSASGDRVAEVFTSRSDLAFALRGDVVLAPVRGFEVIPGARADFFTSEGQAATSVDPRLATRTELAPRTRLLVALGSAHQPPSFVVPLPGVQPGGLRGGLQRSIQESIGVEHDVDEGTTATLTAFHNTFFQMSDPLGIAPRDPQGCPPGSLPTDTLAGDRGGTPPQGFGGPCGVPRFPPGTIGPDRSGGGGAGADSRAASQAADVFEARTLGSSYGLELFVKRRLTRRLGGFVSYTLSRSTRSYDTRKFIATFDRTHVANAAVAYDLGRSWRAGGRFMFYTGLPKAPVPGDDSTRLPPFARLDLRLEKRWSLGQKSWIAFVAEWMNATLSTEAVSTRCTLQGCEAQTVGPVTIPSIGVEGGF